VVDCVKLSELGEKTTVGNILSDAAPELDSLAPVVAPVVQAARLKAVRPDVINIGPLSNIRAWPKHEGFCKLARLLVDRGQTLAVQSFVFCQSFFSPVGRCLCHSNHLDICRGALL